MTTTDRDAHTRKRCLEVFGGLLEKGEMSRRQTREAEQRPVLLDLGCDRLDMPLLLVFPVNDTVKIEIEDT